MNCGRCGHPEVVHGGWARPDGSCGYQGCACKGYSPNECGAEMDRRPGTTPQRFLCTLAPGHEGDHHDSYGPLTWPQEAS